MNRLYKINELLEKNNIDALFLVKQSNVNYISKFTDEASYVLLTKDENYFITDGRFVELAENICKGFTVINWHNSGKGVMGLILDLCKKHKANRLGFEKFFLTFDKYNFLNSQSNNIELVPTSGIIESLRYVKDHEEISYLREASKITDESFLEVLNFVKPGMTELQLAARLEFILKMKGAHGIGFETILISGKNTSLPHGKPDNKSIENGDFITFDFGALISGYTADMTRTVVLGSADEKQKEIYNLVKIAQEKAMDSVKPGVLSNVPDKITREIFKDYIEYYYPGMGHGTGLDLHEDPFISSSSNYTFEKNSVITVEPGLYIPNWGGVRIEDSILITDTGYERLNTCTKELIIL